MSCETKFLAHTCGTGELVKIADGRERDSVKLDSRFGY
jgi:hypothetical protein